MTGYYPVPEYLLSFVSFFVLNGICTGLFGYYLFGTILYRCRRPTFRSWPNLNEYLVLNLPSYSLCDFSMIFKCCTKVKPVLKKSRYSDFFLSNYVLLDNYKRPGQCGKAVAVHYNSCFFRPLYLLLKRTGLHGRKKYKSCFYTQKLNLNLKSLVLAQKN